MSTPIFPKLSIVTFDNRILVTTNVRKKDAKGVYRLIYIQEYLLCSDGDKDEMLNAAIFNVNRRADRSFREEEVDDSKYDSGPAEGTHKYPVCTECMTNGGQVSNYDRFDVAKKFSSLLLNGVRP